MGALAAFPARSATTISLRGIWIAALICATGLLNAPAFSATSLTRVLQRTLLVNVEQWRGTTPIGAQGQPRTVGRCQRSHNK
ncbi:hypothetical protein C8Q74DRAFT_1254891 [Fomes fomentarius]|nr:hypothetical protein C8Q74DRAFT_1254891 [Fomes fomentarius]